MKTHYAILTLALALPLLSASGDAQQSHAGPQSGLVKPTPPAASAPTAVPALVPYSGIGISADGKVVTGEVPVTFLIFKDEVGGEPLFTETQTASFDTVGRYEVQLGATLSNGIPINLFSAGEARWLEVQIAGAATPPRVLLVSVPYALKAGDASTLGGLPASAYALATSSKPQATTDVAAASTNPAGVTANTATNVTTTGGTSGYLPVFNGGSTIINSILFQSSTGIGIGDTPNSSYKLDVNGKSILRGAANLTNAGTANSSAGINSFPLTFNVSAYNSSTKADVNPIFYWQAEPQNNNTASPGATLNLLYSGTNGAGGETGLYLNSNGTVHFPAAQTFVSSAGNVPINGSTASGVGVKGTSTSGMGVDGNSTSGLGVQGNSTSGTGVQGNSNSSYGVEGTSSTGPGVLGYTVGTAINSAGVIGQAGGTSGFTGIAGVWGNSSAHVGVYGTSSLYSGVLGQSASGNGVQGTSTSSDGVYGQTASSTHAGVYGYSSTTSPGAKGGSAFGNGGEFYGGGYGRGILAVGASTPGYLAGYGGELTGGNSTGSGDDESDGATGLYVTGGSASGTSGGYGIESTGGYSANGSPFAGGIFVGGGSGTGIGGDGIVANPGDSSNNGKTDTYAARLNGNVLVGGGISYDDASTRIDHPLDPANKYLNQASIQSSERINLYSGNVITDEQGLAIVKLPGWFEAVNGDLRYQLTMVGHKGQAWISQEVKEGQFQIACDFANAKVSWQITAVRQDAYAKANPLTVEEEKNVRERGFYKHPELYGQPAQKQTEWARDPKRMKALQQRQQNAISKSKSVVTGGAQ